MLKHIRIRNFRSIRQADLAIAPITLLYGPNGSGKSSVLYAPLIIKNSIVHSSTNPNSVFNLPFLNLGSFDEVIHLHIPQNKIEFGIACSKGELDVSYHLEIDKKTGLFKKIPFLWESLNNLIFHSIDIIPANRGFVRTNYAFIDPFVSSVSQEIDTATKIYTSELEKKVQTKLQTIYNTNLKVAYLEPGNFYFQTTNQNKLKINLTNEGFGLNQTVFLLIKALQNETFTILLEKPELHLHPTTQYKLMQVLVKIAEEENKTFVIETHSEIIILTLMSLVRKKLLDPEKIKAYYFTKPENETIIKEQPINEDGQIEGGLASFMEANLEILKAYFKNS